MIYICVIITQIKTKMKYSLSILKEKVEEGQQPKYLFFWGHQPNKDGSIGKGCLSQWWESPFTVEGETYLTAEHWMMAQKAVLFGDQTIRKEILKAESPGKAKVLGRKVKGFNDRIWNKAKYDIVKTGSFHKFNQNSDLKKYLIQTENRVLVEASPVDPVWGIGLPADHLDASQPAMWRGLNLLGFALMEVRDELIKE